MKQKVTEFYLDENGVYQKREYEQDFEFEEPIENQIKRLKQNLANTDYQAIKYSEGELTAEEYEPIKQQRRQWRAEINRLESEVQDVN